MHKHEWIHHGHPNYTASWLARSSSNYQITRSRISVKSLSDMSSDMIASWSSLLYGFLTDSVKSPSDEAAHRPTSLLYRFLSVKHGESVKSSSESTSTISWLPRSSSYAHHPTYSPHLRIASLPRLSLMAWCILRIFCNLYSKLATIACGGGERGRFS